MLELTPKEQKWLKRISRWNISRRRLIVKISIVPVLAGLLVLWLETGEDGHSIETTVWFLFFLSFNLLVMTRSLEALFMAGIAQKLQAASREFSYSDHCP